MVRPRGVEDGAVQSRPGDSKAGGYLSNRDVGSFEQCPDGLDLFGGEFGGTAAFSTASTRRFKASNGAFPDQITFEFGERRKDMKRARRPDSSCLGKFWKAEPGKLSRAPKPRNDPYGEHDFGAISTPGDESVFWKIDYYADDRVEYGADDPGDPSRSFRVLTIMLATEYCEPSVDVRETARG